MNEILTLIFTWLGGVGLGALFFGGLWWTTCRGAASRHPAFWFLGSGLLRMSSVVAGFYFVSAGQWKRLVVCLVGFIFVRLLVTWLTRPALTVQNASSQKASHAP